MTMLRHAAIFAFLLLVPGVVHAQQTQFTKNLPNVGDARGVRVVMDRAKSSGKWDIRLVDRSSSKALGQSSIPEWVGANYYDYSATVRRFKTVVIVLFEARPAPGVDAPKDADVVQVAWARKKSGGKWKTIATTRSSALDGGDRVTFRKGELILIRSSEFTQFCGAKLAAHQVLDEQTLAFKTRVNVNSITQKTEKLSAALAQDFEPSKFRGFARWSSASSDTLNTNDARSVIRPVKLGDESLNTAWTEGATGLGTGEFVTATVNDALKMRAVRIFPGVAETKATFDAHARPKKILISTSEQRYIVDLPSLPYATLIEQGGVVVTFPKPIRTKCLSIVLMDGVQGKPTDASDRPKAFQVGFSEVSLVTELDGLADDVAALVAVEMLLKQKDINKSRRLAQLVRPLDEELIKILERVLRTGDQEDRTRVVPLLRHLPSEESVDILVRLFRDLETEDRAYALVKPAISAHGEIAGTELTTLMQDSPPENERKYIDLTRLIGRLSNPAALDVLIAEMGKGTDRVRRERVRAIAHGNASLIPKLIRVAVRNIDKRKGNDALRAAVGIAKKIYHITPGRLDEASRLADIYDRARSRQSRALATRCASFFAFEGDLDFLRKAAKDEQALVRKYAVSGLARKGGKTSLVAVVDALGDPSPDVRLTAIDGLTRRSDRAEAVGSVIEYAKRETWNGGLQDAYQLLSNSGVPEGVRAVERVLVDTPEKSEASLAARALMRAKKPIAPSTASDLLNRKDLDTRLRSRVIDLLGIDPSPESAKILSSVALDEEPFPFLDGRANMTLRKRAMLSLGRHRTRTSAEALLKILDESTDDDIKSASLRGLAFSKDLWVAKQLRRAVSNVDGSLKAQYFQTLSDIERRADITDLNESLDSLSDSLNEEESKDKDEK